MVIWELRFLDGPGTRVFTTEDVTASIGRPDVLRKFEIAKEIGKRSPLTDAASCLRKGRTLTLVAPMGALAYVVRHELPD